VSEGQGLHWGRILIVTASLGLLAVALLAAPYIKNGRSAAPPSTGAVKTSPPAMLAGPFVGVDLTGLTDTQRLVIGQAAIDFDRARRGLEPTCKYQSMSGFSDGGTTIYECPHYRLTVMKGLFSLQGIDGYLYGPIITFSGDNSVFDVRFYTYHELSKLLGGK